MQTQKLLLVFLLSVATFLPGCHKADSESASNDGAAAVSSAPKTSFGQAVSRAHAAARFTEEEQRRELEQASGDDTSSADK